MHAFQVLGSALLFALSVAAEGSSTSQGPVTMMWGDSKPTPGASSGPAGMSPSSGTGPAMSMGGMSMATATTQPVSALSEVSGMGGMTMETASPTEMTGMQMGGAAVQGIPVVGLAMVGVGAVFGI